MSDSTPYRTAPRPPRKPRSTISGKLVLLVMALFCVAAFWLVTFRH